MANKKFYLERKNLETGKVWTAWCEQADNKYIVKAGSVISDVELKDLSKKMKKIRDEAPIDKDRKLKSDMCFDNLNDAASFVLATNAWGKREWKEKMNADL